MTRTAAKAFLIALTLWVGLTAGAPGAAHALDRDTRALVKMGGYGILAGTVLGLGSVPLTQSGRSIFIGSSVGLYLGLIVGFFYILNRDSPTNPLRPDYHAGYGAGGGRTAAERPNLIPIVTQPALVGWSVEVYRF